MGYQVEVFEANGYPGGKLTSFKLGDYRFDAGHPFSQCLNMLTNSSICKETRGILIIKKDIICKYYWQDGKKLTAYSEKKNFLTKYTLNLEW